MNRTSFTTTITRTPDTVEVVIVHGNDGPVFEDLELSLSLSCAGELRDALTRALGETSTVISQYGSGTCSATVGCR